MVENILIISYSIALIFWQITVYSFNVSATCLRGFPGQKFHVKTSSQAYSTFEVSFCSEVTKLGDTSSLTKVYVTPCIDEHQILQWIQLTCPKRNDKDILKFEFLAPPTEVGGHCIKVSLFSTTTPIQSPSCVISLAPLVSDSSVIAFTIDIEIHNEPFEKLMNGWFEGTILSCDYTKIMTITSVYVEVDFSALNMSNQLLLLKKFSSFLGISMTSLSIKTIVDFPDINSANILRSGFEPKRHISGEKITSLEWIVGCGTVHSSFEPPLKLLDTTADDILGKNIGWNLIFWRVINNAVSLQPHSHRIYEIISEQYQNTNSPPMNYINSSIATIRTQDMHGVEPKNNSHKHFKSDYQTFFTQNKNLDNEGNKDDHSNSRFFTESILNVLSIKKSPKHNIVKFTQKIDLMDDISSIEKLEEIEEGISDLSQYQMLATNKHVSESVNKTEYEIHFDNEELNEGRNYVISKYNPDIGDRSKKKQKLGGTKVNKLSPPLSIFAGNVFEFHLPVFKGTRPKNFDLHFLSSTNSEQFRKHSYKELKNQLSETIGVPPNSWIKLNQTTLYGLALEEHIGNYCYIIALVNNEILTKYELEIEVKSQPISQISHEFEIIIKDVEYSRAIQDVFLRIDLVKRIASAFRDEHLGNILITGMFSGSLRIVWSNLSVPIKSCSYEKLASLMKFIYKDGSELKQISENFISVFKPHLILSVRFIPKNSCKQFPEQMIHQSTDEIQMNPLTNNKENITTLFYITIPIVVVAGLIIILLTCLCCLPRTYINKMYKTATKNGSRNSVPIIFANELKSPISLYPTRPILADQICPRTPPPTYIYSLNMMESNFSSILRYHNHLPTSLERRSLTNDSNSPFSGSSENVKKISAVKMTV